MKQTEVRKPIKFLLNIFIALAVAYSGWQLAKSDKYHSQQIQDLVIAFEAVQHPEGTVQARDVKRISKTIFQNVSADYIAQMYPDQVTKFYLSRLPQNGWRQVGSEQLGIGKYKLKFCQGDLDLDIETLNTNYSTQKTVYYFGVNRQNTPTIQTGC